MQAFVARAPAGFGPSPCTADWERRGEDVCHGPLKLPDMGVREKLPGRGEANVQKRKTKGLGPRACWVRVSYTRTGLDSQICQVVHRVANGPASTAGHYLFADAGLQLLAGGDHLDPCTISPRDGSKF